MISFNKNTIQQFLFLVLLVFAATTSYAETAIGLAPAPAQPVHTKAAEPATTPKKVAVPTPAAVSNVEPEKDANAEEAAANAPKGESWLSAAKAIGATVFVVAMILGAMIFLKRYMPHRFGPLGHSRQIQVLESVPLGEKRMLTLVEVGGQRLLLASSPGNVSLLKELPVTPETRARTEVAIPSKPKDNSVTFNQTLKSQLAAQDNLHDSRTLLVRLSQIRQALETR